MKHKYLEMAGYYDIIDRLKDCALSEGAKEKIGLIEPILSEVELRKSIRETTEAKEMLELAGTPPLPEMKNIDEYVAKAVRAEILFPEQLEELGLFLNAVQRLKYYLKKGEENGIGAAYYSQNLVSPDGLKAELERCIRGGKIDEYASPWLQDLRRQIQALEEKIRQKGEKELRVHKDSISDAFVVMRSGRFCIPVRREKKATVKGSVVDQSAAGSTVFIETIGMAAIREELEYYKTEEEAEERRILYVLMNLVAENESALNEDIRVIQKLDVIFAKGKLSLDIAGVEPEINTEQYLCLEEARHPMLDAQACIPLDIELGRAYGGIVITGPNTGGKTVAIKTVALLSAMACSGLHIPCKRGQICMRSQILCDIGDGQNILDNLSTFSAHIKNVLEILKKVNKESLVIMDELGSGTDPTEGMGIAVSIMEELRKSGALFLVTTHYPEVKEYAARCGDICNARMEFDKETLKPLYRLKVGEAGESCAFFIARQLGFPREMLENAAIAAYGKVQEGISQELKLEDCPVKLEKASAPRIRRTQRSTTNRTVTDQYTTGDSVVVYPEEKIGIVVRPADTQGEVLVQVQKKKMLINHKRLKLKAKACELYPEDYDFSIIFDTVENRKARHKMGKRHQEDLVITEEN